MSDHHAAFIRQFLRHPFKTGAVAPSSARLAVRVVNTADLPTARVIAELGPGTGVFTAELHRRRPTGCDLFAIELDPGFAAATRQRCPEVDVYSTSATRLGAILAERGHTHCCRVVSSLPWAAFPDELQDELLAAIHAALAPNGLLVTYAYVQGVVIPSARRFRRRLGSLFRDVRRTPVTWRNLPPAFIYRATR